MSQNSAMKLMFAAPLALLAVLSIVTVGCADTSSSGGGVNVVKGPEPSSQPTSGISPDKEAEIQLLLQQRNPSTLKCYSDVLNEKHDRAFKGTVIVLISLQPNGSQAKVSDVKVIGGTMTDKEVTSCVVDKLKEFE
ncbi:MAG TPA: hypothetical protein VIF57_18715, partial [Polyangia bacterium]